MILVYNIFSVALPEAKLAFLEALATLVMLTWLLIKPQKKYLYHQNLISRRIGRFKNGQIAPHGTRGILSHDSKKSKPQTPLGIQPTLQDSSQTDVQAAIVARHARATRGRP